MKTNKHSILHYSLFAALIGVVPVTAFSAMRVGNHTRSYADAYNQVNAQVAAATSGSSAWTTTTTTASQSDTTTDPSANLPVRVADDTLAQQIANGDSRASVSMAQLDNCAMIYPNGEFEWARPTLGTGTGGAATCVAVVEMRGYQMGPNGEDVVLARANLAAGDSVQCNISAFPSVSYTQAAGEIEFPADNPPTREDVERQMNIEQKQNAGLRIAAGAILGGLVGNIAGAGTGDSLLGTNQEKIQGSALGALGGAALMAGNVYAGKVAGDTILSAGVNAAAGSAIGNMAATGESVLRIDDCVVDGRETTCLFGAVATGKTLNLTTATGASASSSGTGGEPAPQTAFYNFTTEETYVCDAELKNCERRELISVVLDGLPKTTVNYADRAELDTLMNDLSRQFYFDSETKTMHAGNNGSGDGIFAQIRSASEMDRQVAAMIPDVQDTAFGIKYSDWGEWQRSHRGVRIVGRNTAAQSFALDGEYSIDDFYPMVVDAAGGSVIDFGNKARLKNTLIGAGAGGAMGALAGYQGAQDDVENRLVTETMRYQDSLSNIYCATGNRYLSQYNDMVYVPAMVTDE